MNTVTANPINQFPDGAPVMGQADFPNLVAADAIAALSRTNLRSVVRVLIAIDALTKRLHVDAARIVDVTRAPTETPKAHQNEEVLFETLPLEKRQRILAVDALMDDIDGDPEMLAHLELLDRR